MMKTIGSHVNLINFLGCCTQSGPVWVIVEYAPHGNLRDFLRKHRHLLSSSSSSYERPAQLLTLTAGNLVSFARQCAKGMEYLAAQKVSISWTSDIIYC